MGLEYELLNSIFQWFIIFQVILFIFTLLVFLINEYENILPKVN